MDSLRIAAALAVALLAYPAANGYTAEDPALHDGRYDEGRKRAGGPKFGGDKR